MKILVLGATGRTGRPFCRLAAAAGHDVEALVRRPVDVEGARTHVGEIDADTIRRLRPDVVVSGLGVVKGGPPDVCSRAARAITEAGVRRAISVSGAGIDVDGDRKTFGNRVVSAIVKRVGGDAVRDKEEELAVFRAHDTLYTLVRVPRLVEGQPRGVFRFEDTRGPLATTLDREDLARALLEIVDDKSARFHRRAPFVSW